MLDVKDKKILAELIFNSRIAMTKLARKVGVSREMASYRLKRLASNPITSYYAIIDVEALGFKRYGCYLQLKGIDLKAEQDFFDKLKKNQFVTYLGPIIGKWNVCFDIIARDENHLHEVVEGLFSTVRSKVESFIVNTPVSFEETYPAKFLGSKDRVIIKKKTIPGEIDTKDLKILSILAADSRADYQSLTKSVRLSANAIKNRIKGMEKAGVISGYTISLDYSKLGLLFYNIQIKTEGRIDPKLVSYLRKNKNVVYFYTYLGHENWDLDIGVIVKSSDELRSFMVALKEHFWESLKVHDLYLIAQVIKENHAPEGVFSMVDATH